MRALQILAFAVAILIIAWIVAGPAFAADGALPATSLLEPIRAYLVEIGGVLIVAFVGWLSSWLRATFKLELDARHRDALHSALTNGAALVLKKLDTAAAGKSIPIGNAIVGTGIEYVLTYSPDAVAYFGLTPERVGELLRARLIPAGQV
ncbi:hypothetical protein [Mesorhizobium sp. KR1-2]|uniref:hypothetical protein n=1 Tax=Mesorhizobium sp. KR1-2 TaxID=3156609 RepID=UPI0032B3FDF9